MLSCTAHIACVRTWFFAFPTTHALNHPWSRFNAPCQNHKYATAQPHHSDELQTVWLWFSDGWTPVQTCTHAHYRAHMYEHMSHTGLPTNLSHILHSAMLSMHTHPSQTHEHNVCTFIGLIQHIIIHNRGRARLSNPAHMCRALVCANICSCFCHWQH